MQVRKVAEDNGVDVSGQIKELEQRAMQVRSSAAVLPYNTISGALGS